MRKQIGINENGLPLYLSEENGKLYGQLGVFRKIDMGFFRDEIDKAIELYEDKDKIFNLIDDVPSKEKLVEFFGKASWNQYAKLVYIF